MEEIKGNDKRAELATAVKEGVKQTKDIISVIGERLKDCALSLRVEQTEEVFRELMDGFENMDELMNFVTELKRALETLDITEETKEDLSCWDRSVELFEGMLDAFKKKDWITLSDLIEYELHPLLIQGADGFTRLEGKV